jgi:hypothetical protein
MSDKIKPIPPVIVAMLSGLSALSRRFPHIAWLQHFDVDVPQLSEEQKAKMRRRSNLRAGVKWILLGIVLPMGYAVHTVMLFSDITRTGMAIVLTGSVVCIAVGVTAIVRAFDAKERRLRSPR